MLFDTAIIIKLEVSVIIKTRKNL